MRIRSSSLDPPLGTNAEETWDDPSIPRVASADHFGEVEGTNTPEDPTMLSSGWSVVSEAESQEGIEDHRHTAAMNGLDVAEAAVETATQASPVGARKQEDPRNTTDLDGVAVTEVAIETAMQHSAVTEVAVNPSKPEGDDLSELQSPSEVSRPGREAEAAPDKDEVDDFVGTTPAAATPSVVSVQVFEPEDCQMTELPQVARSGNANIGSDLKRNRFSVLYLILSCVATAAMTIAGCAIWDDQTWRLTALKLEESLRDRESALTASEEARRLAEDEKERLEKICESTNTVDWDDDASSLNVETCWVRMKASLALGNCADETVHTVRDAADNLWEWGRSWWENPFEGSGSNFATAGVTLSSLKKAGGAVASSIAESTKAANQLFEHWQNDDLADLNLNKDLADDIIDTSELSKLWDKEGEAETL